MHRKQKQILIYFIKPFQLAGLHHETMAGGTYNWTSDIWADINIEEVNKF